MLKNTRRLAMRVNGPRPRNSLRLQRNSTHKEYFQDPQNIPARQPFQSSPPVAPRSSAANASQSSPFPTQPNVTFSRVARSTAWVLTSALLGVFSAGLLLSWAYVNEPFAPGSDADTAMLEEIEDLFETNNALMNLRASPDWVELVSMPSLDKNLKKDMMFQSLNGSRGIQTKTFFNSKRKLINIFVCFGGGVEGWPDVVHGGSYFIILQEAMHSLMGCLYPNQVVVACQMGANFRRKMKPHVVYRLSAGPKHTMVDTSDGVVALKDTQKDNGLEILGLLVEDDIIDSVPARAQDTGIFVEGWGWMAFVKTDPPPEEGLPT
ncbi:MAG: hypothetical protein Q9160_000769 [Pyrenula sp. 1 TL-2023]